jgi:hypothetical protein
LSILSKDVDWVADDSESDAEGDAEVSASLNVSSAKETDADSSDALSPLPASAPAGKATKTTNMDSIKHIFFFILISPDFEFV